MATVREYQEQARAVADMICEVKDDIEKLFEQGEYNQLGLFDLYQKVDDLADVLDCLTTFTMTEAVLKTPVE